eukprot:8982_1
MSVSEANTIKKIFCLAFFHFLLYLCNGYSCTTNSDCELLGKCINNKCECNNGWTGDSCGTINLGTSPTHYLWPLIGSQTTETDYSWGFTVVHSNSDNLYHAYVNNGCYNISDQSQPMVSGTFLLHLTSTTPTGPFISQDITMPVSSFNPHILYSSILKKYILFFRINELTPYPYCFGNQTDINITYKYPSNLTAHTMDVAASDSPYGPWDVSIIIIQNMPKTHISNPSAIELSNGTWVLAYRFNTNNEYVGIAISKGDYKGPYVNIANLSVPAEDPYLWQSSVDNSFHIIFHVMNHQSQSEWPSLHAYSNNLYDWNVSKSYTNFGKGCYSTNVTWNDGNVTTFFRRERPDIMFSNGKPIWFYTAAQEFKNDSHFGYSYSVVQSIL